MVGCQFGKMTGTMKIDNSKNIVCLVILHHRVIEQNAVKVVCWVKL